MEKNIPQLRIHCPQPPQRYQPPQLLDHPPQRNLYSPQRQQNSYALQQNSYSCQHYVANPPTSLPGTQWQPINQQYEYHRNTAPVQTAEPSMLQISASTASSFSSLYSSTGQKP